MAAIYQLMIGNKQMGDVYYNEADAVDNAIQIAIVSMMGVEIWEAEEIDDTPYDELEWSILRVILA